MILFVLVALVPMICQDLSAFEQNLTYTGLGQGYATGLNQVFTFWCYATPIASAIAADHHFGRLKTIVYSCLIYTIGLAVLSISSWSTTDDYRVSLGGLLVAMALIGIGTGGIKPNVGPLIAEQYARPKESIHQFKDGEMVVLDYDLTIQRFVIKKSHVS